MATILVAALILGWILVSAGACVVVCMISSRFSNHTGQFDAEYDAPVRSGAPRDSRFAPVRLDNGPTPLELNAG